MIKLKSLLMEGMTRQHFEFVVKLLKIKDHEQQVQFAINFFKKENPRFDENKFRKAVGVKPQKFAGDSASGPGDMHVPF